MGRIPIPGDESDTSSPVVRSTLPQFPRPPTVPETAFPERLSEAGGLEITPLAGPSIPIPKTEDEDFLRRYEKFRAATLASIPEYIVWEFLVFKKKQVDGLDFIFQVPFLGGRTEFGGFVLDFFFPITRVGWRVQGERFHLLQSIDRARDAIGRALLEGQGVKILDLWETDILTRPDFVLEAAWEGREVQSLRPEAG